MIFFNKKHPNVNEKWILKEDKNDPFPPIIFNPVTILEIKDKWVRYNMGRPFPDERMPIKEFISIYKLYKD